MGDQLEFPGAVGMGSNINAAKVGNIKFWLTTSDVIRKFILHWSTCSIDNCVRSSKQLKELFKSFRIRSHWFVIKSSDWTKLFLFEFCSFWFSKQLESVVVVVVAPMIFKWICHTLAGYSTFNENSLG